MAVHFSEERMQQVLQRHTQWWRGELQDPLMVVTLQGVYAKEQRTDAPPLNQQTCTDFSWSPEEVIDGIEGRLSTFEFLGDAFPWVNFDAFGPGVLAAFCGAKLDNSSGRVWFHPAEELEIEDIHVQYDPNNIWVKRIKDIYRAGLKRWGKTVVMGMPDLGGVLDVAATFRGTENLLMDLIDEPDEVLRLCGEIETAWREAYTDLASVLHPQSAGYSDWSGLLSPTPSYITQCDFCYMISNPMFREFVLPTMQNDVNWLSNIIYHLDGVGELNHLDTLLELDKLTAIQWVAGAGKPGPMHWLDVYRKIKGADKRMMLLGKPDETIETIRTIGGKDVYYKADLNIGEEDVAERLLSI